METSHVRLSLCSQTVNNVSDREACAAAAGSDCSTGSTPLPVCYGSIQTSGGSETVSGRLLVFSLRLDGFQNGALSVGTLSLLLPDIFFTPLLNLQISSFFAFILWVNLTI